MVCAIRYISHFISGATIWTEYAPDTAIKAVLAYSASYNATYMIPETVISVIGICAVIALLSRFAPKEKTVEETEEKTAE